MTPTTQLPPGTHNAISPRHFGEMLAVARGYCLIGSTLHALCVITDLHSCTMDTLCRHTGIATAAATGVADRLVGLGLIHRMHGTADRRSVWVEPTDLGKQIMTTILNSKPPTY